MDNFHGLDIDLHDWYNIPKWYCCGYGSNSTYETHKNFFCFMAKTLVQKLVVATFLTQ